jgi:hypothetical protein
MSIHPETKVLIYFVVFLMAVAIGVSVSLFLTYT